MVPGTWYQVQYQVFVKGENDDNGTKQSTMMMMVSGTKNLKMIIALTYPFCFLY